MPPPTPCGTCGTMANARPIMQALLAAPWPTKLLRHPPLPGVAPPDDPAAEVVLLHRYVGQHGAVSASCYALHRQGRRCGLC